MREQGLSADEARRRALVAFGGVEKHKEAVRDGRGTAWVTGLSLDVKLGGRMLVKYPVLTLAGGLALAIAIGIGAGWYDMMGKLLAPTIPLPDGDRIVVVETHNILTSEPEARVARDFLEWRRDLRTLEDLGAYPRGRPQPDRRRRGARADQGGGADRRRVPDRARGAVARPRPDRRRRGSRRTACRRARLRRLAARPRRAARCRRPGGEAGADAGERGRRHAGGIRVSLRQRRLGTAGAPWRPDGASRAVRSAL